MAIHCWGKYNMGNAIAKVKMAFAMFLCIILQAQYIALTITLPNNKQ